MAALNKLVEKSEVDTDEKRELLASVSAFVKKFGHI